VEEGTHAATGVDPGADEEEDAVDACFEAQPAVSKTSKLEPAMSIKFCFI
jgi:hypothetical protein